MRWKILYVDGTVFSSHDGVPCDAPGGGVLAVAQEDPDVGILTHYGSDFYVYDAAYGGWAGMDVFGLAQYLTAPGHKIVKLGKTMDTRQYRAALKAFRAEPGLPPKSARYPWEPPS